MDSNNNALKPMISGQAKHYLIQVAISGGASFIFIWQASIYVDSGELGTYLLLFSYATVVAGTLNLGLVLGYERGFFEYEESQTKQYSLLSSLFYSSLMIFAIFWVIFHQLFVYISAYTRFDIVDSLLLYSGACAYILQQYFTTHFRCGGASRRFLIYASMPQVLMVLFLFAIASVDSSSYALALSYFYAQVISLLLVMLGNRSMLSSLLKYDLSLVRKTLRISFPMTPRVVLGLLGNQVDKIFVGELIGPNVLAAYGIAQSISIAVFQFMSALGRVFQPTVYRLCFGKSENVDLGALLIPYLKLSMVFAIFVSIATYYVIEIGFAEAYKQVPYAVNILVIGYLLLFLGKVSGVQLSVGKKLLYSVIGTIISIVINVLTVIPFYEYFSLNGVALAFVISQVSSVLIMYAIAQNVLRLSFPLREIFFSYGVFLLLFISFSYLVANVSMQWHFAFDTLVVLLLMFYLYKSGLIYYLRK